MIEQNDFPVYSFMDLSSTMQGKQGIEHLVFITEEDASSRNLQEFLNKILGATRIGKQSYIIITVDSFIDISSIYALYNIKNILIFGINPIKLGLKIKTSLYEVIKLNGMSIIIGHSLEKLENYPEGKKLLWNSMKSTF